MNVPKNYTEADVHDIVKKVQSLRQLTKISGTITTRSQSAILRELPDDVLVRVSLLLAEVTR